jgi:hypothetical protein
VNKFASLVIGCIAMACAMMSPPASHAQTAELPPYAFSEEDDAFLEEVSRASFQYFKNYQYINSGMIQDRSDTPTVCSIASIGFGLPAYAIAAERGWMSRVEAQIRTVRALRTLEASPARRWGFYAHYLDMQTGGPTTGGYEKSVSTIDTALMIAGALAAGEYFGGEAKEIANRIYAEMDWTQFVNPASNNQVRMAWIPDDVNNYAGSGSWGVAHWNWYSDETLLVNMLGICAPNPDYRLDPQVHLNNWNRTVRVHDGEAFIVSWPGTLFTYTFAQCFYDFTRYGPDPQGVDWFENSRVAVRANRDWCRANAGTYATYGVDRWGITACSSPTGYAVPGHQPRGASGSNPVGGVIAPYGAGMAVLWEPNDAISALRHMKGLSINGKPVWTPSGHGFVDAFNVDENWTSPNLFGIANGPMLLCIENARTGMIWNLFHSNQHIADGMLRAGFVPVPHGADGMSVY